MHRRREPGLERRARHGHVEIVPPEPVVTSPVPPANDKAWSLAAPRAAHPSLPRRKRVWSECDRDRGCSGDEAADDAASDAGLFPEAHTNPAQRPDQLSDSESDVSEPEPEHWSTNPPTKRRHATPAASTASTTSTTRSLVSDFLNSGAWTALAPVDPHTLAHELRTASDTLALLFEERHDDGRSRGERATSPHTNHTPRGLGAVADAVLGWDTIEAIAATCPPLHHATGTFSSCTTTATTTAADNDNGNNRGRSGASASPIQCPAFTTCTPDHESGHGHGRSRTASPGTARAAHHFLSFGAWNDLEVPSHRELEASAHVLGFGGRPAPGLSLGWGDIAAMQQEAVPSSPRPSSEFPQTEVNLAHNSSDCISGLLTLHSCASKAAVDETTAQ